MDDATTKQLAGLVVVALCWALAAAGWLLVGLGLLH
jgi:hypothetical protein